jgi:hypothetical protein
VEAPTVNSAVAMIIGYTSDNIPKDRTRQLFERFLPVRGDEGVPGLGWV